MIYQASMPANIALIKYMGKQNSNTNLPANASLSYTLNHLRSTVTLSPVKGSQHSWHCDTHWTIHAQQRFVKHLDFLRQKFAYTGYFELHSVNNFPDECGLASSASSFAALTICALQAFGVNASATAMANLSRQGSGSACRSFFAPWCMWQQDQITTLDLPEVIHAVIVVDQQPKAVSSSQAHQRILSSLLYQGRNGRAETRLQQLLPALQAQDWRQSYELCWQEFQDMHALFATSHPHFTYMVPHSVQVLQQVQHGWETQGDGPLVTMDAGPNIHLLFRLEQQALAKQLLALFRQQYLVFVAE